MERTQQQPDGSFKQADLSPLPRAEITPAPLKGEPKTDKRFKVKGGKDVRVRLESVGVAKEGGIAATEHCFKVTVTLLDKKGGVMRNAGGEVMILAEHDITYASDDLARLAESGRSIADDIDDTLAELAYRANKAFEGVTDLETTMSQWK